MAASTPAARVYLPSDVSLNEVRVHEQTQAFLKHVERAGLRAANIVYDRDAKFTESFDDILESANLDAIKAARVRRCPLPC